MAASHAREQASAACKEHELSPGRQEMTMPASDLRLFDIGSSTLPTAGCVCMSAAWDLVERAGVANS